ncbi:MAG: 4'-phosphopantetheinyl transferase superfamily protein [Acetatifactor sp.]|nr:4'-phosphopantetheinyl transferase superfamily protein [Acetatifactor sp.]
MNIYLLNIEELIQGDAGIPADSMLHKVDEARRAKVLAAKTVQGKAAELGAGLLLQKAVQDWKRDKPQQSPRIRFCTVSGLFSELTEPLPLTYRYGDKGKPYFENIPLFFSLSHSGEYVLCAVSRQEVGADIQKIQPSDVLKLAKRFFSEPECRALERCESDREQQGLFFGLWSRKEAYGKLTGEGVTAVLGKDMQNTDAKRNVEWIDVSPPEGYALAVCRFKFPCKHGI